MTREKVVLYGERVESKNQAPWMGGYWFLKICFSREGCEKYIRFFFWKCHVSRWTRQGFYFQDNRVCNRIFIFFRRILIGILRALFRFEEDLYKIKNKYIYIYIFRKKLFIFCCWEIYKKNRILELHRSNRCEYIRLKLRASRLYLLKQLKR